MAVYRMVGALLVLSVCAANGDSDNATENVSSQKIIEWRKPLTFKHILDSKDPEGKIYGGIILSVAIIGGLLLLGGVLLIIQWIRDRLQKPVSHKRYGRLYDQNITIQSDVEKV